MRKDFIISCSLFFFFFAPSLALSVSISPFDLALIFCLLSQVMECWLQIQFPLMAIDGTTTSVRLSYFCCRWAGGGRQGGMGVVEG